MVWKTIWIALGFCILNSVWVGYKYPDPRFRDTNYNYWYWTVAYEKELKQKRGGKRKVWYPKRKEKFDKAIVEGVVDTAAFVNNTRKGLWHDFRPLWYEFCFKGHLLYTTPFGFMLGSLLELLTALFLILFPCYVAIQNSNARRQAYLERHAPEALEYVPDPNDPYAPYSEL